MAKLGEQMAKAADDSVSRALNPSEVNVDEVVTALRVDLFEAWKGSMLRRGYDVTGWKMADESEAVINPLGGLMDLRSAVFALDRIKGIAEVGPLATVAVFSDVLPAELLREGSPTIVVWATCDGQICKGAAQVDLTRPDEPALLVGVAGESPAEAQWTDPVKVYRLLEFGYGIRRYEPDREEWAREEDVPF